MRYGEIKEEVKHKPRQQTEASDKSYSTKTEQRSLGVRLYPKLGAEDFLCDGEVCQITFLDLIVLAWLCEKDILD